MRMVTEISRHGRFRIIVNESSVVKVGVMTWKSSSTVPSLIRNHLQITIKHNVVSQISFKITSIESLSLMEFILYIMDSISTWTGLSVIACNPVVVTKQIVKCLQKSKEELGLHKNEIRSENKHQNQLRRLRELQRIRQLLQSFSKQTPNRLNVNWAVKLVSEQQ